MMTRRAWLASVAGLIIAGAATTAPIHAFTDPASTEIRATSADPAKAKAKLRGVIVNSIARQLGLTPEALKQAVKSGQTLSEIAAARGVADLNALKPALISDVQAALTQANVSAKRATKIVTRLQNADLNTVLRRKK